MSDITTAHTAQHCHECCAALSREIDAKLATLREKYPDLVALIEDLRREQQCAAERVSAGDSLPPFVPFVYPVYPYPVFPPLPAMPQPPFKITCGEGTTKRDVTS